MENNYISFYLFFLYFTSQRNVLTLQEASHVVTETKFFGPRLYILENTPMDKKIPF